VASDAPSFPPHHQGIALIGDDILRLPWTANSGSLISLRGDTSAGQSWRSVPLVAAPMQDYGVQARGTEGAMAEDGSLWPVVAGGLLTLGGTIAAALGTVIRDLVQRRSEERKRRSDKFEELVAAVYEFDHWLDRLKDRFIFGADLPETVSPFGKVQSISSVYFPQFSTLANDLDEAATGLSPLDVRSWGKATRTQPISLGS
jgi:hypothetical protein